MFSLFVLLVFERVTVSEHVFLKVKYCVSMGAIFVLYFHNLKSGPADKLAARRTSGKAFPFLLNSNNREQFPLNKTSQSNEVPIGFRVSFQPIRT